MKVQTKNTIQLTKLTEVLCREKKRSDDLIYKLVPADIAKKLKNHIAVTPEIFDSVSGRFLNCSFFSNFSRKDKQSFRTKICNCINIESMHNRNI